MNRVFYHFITAIILSMSPASADILAGRVTSGSTGKPVAGATVLIVERNETIRTDENGAFTFGNLSAGRCTVRVRGAGYVETSVEGVVPGTADIVLAAVVYRIDEVISTARGRDTGIATIPGSVAVSSEEDIRKSQPASIAETLDAMPGLTVNSAMPWASRIVVRGLTKDHVVVLVDGNRIVTATDVPAQFGMAAPADIERVEVLKGPLSVLYGSGSTGGVINIITRRGSFSSNTTTSFMAEPSYVSGNSGISLYERAGISGPRGYVTLSQTNRVYGDYRAGGGERIPNSQFEDRQTQMTFGLRLTGTQTLEGRWQSYDVLGAGIPGGTAFPATARVSYPSTSRNLYDLTWSIRADSGWWRGSTVTAYYQPVERLVSLIPNVTNVIPNKPRAGQSTRVTPTETRPSANHLVSGARWRNEFAFGTHTLVAGVETWRKHMETRREKYITKEIVDNTSGNILNTINDVIVEESVPKSTQQPIGIFVEDGFMAGERLHLTLGARVDRIHTENDRSYATETPPSDVVLWEKHGDDDTDWSAVAGGVYELTDRIDLNLAASRAFRSPTIEERYKYINLGKTPIEVGNPDLDSERGTFVEAGLTARGETATIQVSAFVNSVTGMVILRPGETFNGLDANVYSNAGKALLRGGEASAAWLPAPSVLIEGSLSYVRGTDKEAGENLPFMPPVNGRVSARWNPGRSLWVEPSMTVSSRKTRCAPGEDETAGYGIVDITGGVRLPDIFGSECSLVGGVKNAADKRYTPPLAESRAFPLYGTGRSVFVSVRIGR